jgi:hypothetical protein
MSVKVQIKHRGAGAGGAGSPAAVGLAGELAVNFDVNGTPELWGSTGAVWSRLNPAATAPTVGTVNIPGGTVGSKAGIGAAWAAVAAKPTDPIIIGTFAGTAYVKTGAGGVDSDWTALGSATSFATSAELLAGTSTDKAITPAALKASSTSTPAGAPDAGKLLVLNAAGKLDASALTIKAFDYRGNADLTVAYVAPAPAEVAGNFFTVAATGAVEASWVAKFAAGQAPTTVTTGDSVFFDGTNYHHLVNTVSTSDKVAKAGANAITAGMAMTWSAAAAVTTIIDGGDVTKSKIDNVSIDCGTF